MICQLCKKKKTHLINIFYKFKGVDESEQIQACRDCEGEMERKFEVYIKSRIARAFISKVKSRGEYVKDVIVDLMEDFVQNK
jgi:hypothetical protein